jgi:hypothetical protein
MRRGAHEMETFERLSRIRGDLTLFYFCWRRPCKAGARFFILNTRWSRGNGPAHGPGARSNAAEADPPAPASGAGARGRLLCCPGLLVGGRASPGRARATGDAGPPIVEGLEREARSPGVPPARLALSPSPWH